eukprot:TRINITY_DN671_c0_g3_i1.p1 TRINITY_DN671_c0_g3~~TRINITY_DN671_c0_g3_i1.p1  ORF type:complete len:1172 (+),score=276.01 TRINITY_DN671_c0_g3_i1:2-3517(+)
MEQPMSDTELETELPQCSSSWRSFVLTRGRENPINDIEVVGLENYDAAELMVSHDSRPLAMLANCGEQRNICKVVDIDVDIMDIEVVKEFKTDARVSAFDWIGDDLLVGDNLGNVHVRSMDGKFLSELVKPSNYAFTNKTNHSKSIQSLHLNRSTNMLIASQYTNVLLWDLSNGLDREPLSYHQCKSSQTALRWGHIFPQTYVCGSYNRSLEVYDIREEQISVWTQDKAHKTSVTDVKWNPFVPYWIASSGADASIKIWDLRYNSGCIMELTDHYNAINSISWSPNHCEILASGSSDRSYKIWSLREKPHHVIASEENFNGSVVATCWSQGGSKLSRGLVVSALGEVKITNLEREFLLPLVNRTTEADWLSNTENHIMKLNQIEEKIYCRDFVEAFRQSLSLATYYTQQENMIDTAYKFLDICCERMPVNVEEMEPESWHVANFSIEQFEIILDAYSYFIPPYYPDLFWPQIPQHILDKMEHTKINLDMEMFMKQEDTENMFKMIPQIQDVLKNNFEAVPSATIYRIIQKLMDHSYEDAIKVGLEFAKLYKRKTKLFSKSAHLLLYPTIFEPKDSTMTTTETKSLEKNLLRGSNVTTQIEILIEFTNIILNNGSEKEVIDMVKKFDLNDKYPILSVSINKCYLRALLNSGMYQEFYVKITSILTLIPNGYYYNEFYSIMNESFPTFKKYVQRVRLRSDEVDETRDCIYMLMTILKDAVGLPSERIEIISSQMKYMVFDLEEYLKKMPRQIACDYVNDIWNIVYEIISTRKSNRGEKIWRVALDALIEKLNEYSQPPDIPTLVEEIEESNIESISEISKELKPNKKAMSMRNFGHKFKIDTKKAAGTIRVGRRKSKKIIYENSSEEYESESRSNLRSSKKNKYPRIPKLESGSNLEVIDDTENRKRKKNEEQSKKSKHKKKPSADVAKSEDISEVDNIGDVALSDLELSNEEADANPKSRKKRKSRLASIKTTDEGDKSLKKKKSSARINIESDDAKSRKKIKKKKSKSHITLNIEDEEEISSSKKKKKRSSRKLDIHEKRRSRRSLQVDASTNRPEKIKSKKNIQIEDTSELEKNNENISDERSHKKKKRKSHDITTSEVSRSKHRRKKEAELSDPTSTVEELPLLNLDKRSKKVSGSSEGQSSRRGETAASEEDETPGTPVRGSRRSHQN